MANPSIWDPSSDTVPAVRPQTFQVTQTFYAVEGQSVFDITAFTYTVNTGTLRVYVNGARVTNIQELSSSSFGLPIGVTAKVGDKVFVEAILEEVADAGATLLRADLASNDLTKGSALVIHTPDGTGADSASVQTVLRRHFIDGDAWINPSYSAATNTTRWGLLLAHIATLARGVEVRLSSADYPIDGITIPAGVIVKGSGERATRLLYGGSGIAVLLGGTASSVYYGTGITDLSVITTNIAAEAITAKGTVGAKIHDIYIEGSLTYPRTTKGVTLDGGNASSYFNSISNVICNHIHAGFDVTTTGSQVATQQFFTNCSSLGDVADDASSRMLNIAANCGNGTTWVGGNAETCGTAINYEANAGSISVSGLRFEGNTTDLKFGAGVLPQSFFGLINLNQTKISDSSNGQHTYLGCVDSNPSDATNPYNVMPGNTVFKSMGTGKTPLIVKGFAGQAADLQQVKNSSGTVIAGIASDGGFFTNRIHLPAVQVPSADPNDLDDYQETESWIPDLGADGGYSGQVYVTQIGTAIKVGRLVIATAEIYLSNKGTLTGNLQIRNWPYASANIAASTGSMHVAGNAVATVAHSNVLNPNSTSVFLYKKTAAAADFTTMTSGDITNNFYVTVTMCYMAAA